MGDLMVAHLFYTMRELHYVFNLGFGLGPGVDPAPDLFNMLHSALNTSFGNVFIDKNEVCGKFQVYDDLDHVIQASEILTKTLHDCGLEVKPKNGPLDMRMLRSNAWRLASYPMLWSSSIQKMMVAENLSPSVGRYDLKTTSYGTLYYVRSFGDKVYLNARASMEVYVKARRETSSPSWDEAKGVVEGRIHEPMRMPRWAMDMIHSTNESGVGALHHDVVPP